MALPWYFWVGLLLLVIGIGLLIYGVIKYVDQKKKTTTHTSILIGGGVLTAIGFILVIATLIWGRGSTPKNVNLPSSGGMNPYGPPGRMNPYGPGGNPYGPGMSPYGGNPYGSNPYGGMSQGMSPYGYGNPMGQGMGQGPYGTPIYTPMSFGMPMNNQFSQ